MQTMRHLCSFWINTLLIVAVNAITLSFPAGSVTLSTSLTFKPNVQYTMSCNFQYNIDIPANSIVIVQFTTRYITPPVLSGCAFTYTNGTAYTNTGCTTSNSTGKHELTYSGIYQSAMTNQGFLSLKFTINNPWAAASETITVLISDSIANVGTPLATGSIPISFQASSLDSCSYVSSNDTTGVSSTRTITFTPSVSVLANSYLLITIPTWRTSTSSLASPFSLPCVGNTDGTLSCSNAPSVYTQNLNVTSGLFTSTKTIPGPVIINMSNIKNPWSLQPFAPISFQLMYSSQVIQSCAGMSQNVTRLSLASSSSFGLPATPNISTVYSNRTITFKTKNYYLLSSGQFQITYSSSISISYLLGVGTIIVNNVVTGNITTLQFSGITTSDINGGGSVNLTAGLAVTTPPSSRPFTITFTTLNISSSIPYGIDTYSLTYFCATGTLTSASVKAASYAVNAQTQYYIAFTIVNALASGSYIGITFPSGTSIVPSSNCSGNNAFISCSVISSSYANLSLSSTFSVGSAFNFTFQAINPDQAYTTSSFSINTYYDSGLDSLVDKLTSGITLTTIPKVFSSATVTPASQITYNLTSYSFTANVLDKIPANGFLVINFPPTITLGTLSLTSASFGVAANCFLSPSGNTLNITSCITADVTNLSLAFTISGINNPPSLQTTTSFSIFTYGPLGQVNNLTTGLTLNVSTAATSTIFSISSLNQTVHTFTDYTLTVTLAVPHQTNDYFVLSLPTSMAFSPLPSCNALVGVTNLSCLILSGNLRVTLGSKPTGPIQVNISSIRNYDIAGTSVSFNISFYSSTNFLMETTPNSSIIYTATSLSQCSVSNNDQIALNQASNITLTISTPFSIHSSFLVNGTSIKIVLPAELTLIANSSCNSGLGTCATSNGTAIVSNVGLGLTNSTVTLFNIQVAGLNGSSSSFSVYFLYQGLNVATQTSGVVLTAYCTNPCQRCVSTKTACATCLPSPNLAIYLYTVNSSCLSGCPDTYFPNISVCSSCVPTCLWCLDAVNCTKCVNNTWLMGKSCLATCPPTYYNDSSGVCLPCITPCGNCTTLNNCSSCIVDFFSNFKCVNASSCPPGTYGNTTTHICQNCSPLCSNCTSSPTTCTSCPSGKVLFNNTCLPNCPSGMYNSSNVCQNCIPPCGDCTSLSNCTNCVANFFYSFSCVNASACPAGTFGNTTNHNCDACSPQCANCTSSPTSCSSCPSGKLLFNSSCMTNCPNGMYNDTNTCQNCSFPCGNCSNSSYCLSCQANFLSSGSCVTAGNCPNGTFADANQSICASCPGGCTGCISLSNCSGCSSFFLFSNFQCVTSCPNGTYQSGSVCQACSSTCNTCTGGPSSCTSCPSGQFLFNATCQGTCPLGTFISNGVCSQCLSTCQSCSNGTGCTGCKNGAFLTGNQCQTGCPAGTFQDVSTNNCTSCSSTCLTCTQSASNCTGCLPTDLLYQGSCGSSCPGNYFNVSGVCLTCSNCLNCTSATVCQVCLSGYFMLNGACYISCPSISIADLMTFTCTTCDPSCYTCSGSVSTCTGCKGGLYLLNSVCISSCPTGYVEDVGSGTCTRSLLGNIVYFPTLISFTIWAILVGYSRYRWEKTEVVTCLTAGLSVFAWISWTILVSAGSSLKSSANSAVMGAGLLGILVSIGLGISFNLWLRNSLFPDAGFSEWADYNNFNRNSYKVMAFLSCVTYPVFRLLYSRMFERPYLSAFFLQGGRLLSACSWITAAFIGLSQAPLLFVCGYVIYIQGSYSQILLSAIDSLILSVLLLLLLIIDTASKDQSYFKSLIDGQPYLKRFKYDDLDNSMASLRSMDFDHSKKYRSELDPKDKEDFFRRKVNFLQELNKYGHLNAPLPQNEDDRRVKTLPTDLQKLPQLDPNDDDNFVINDDLFFADEERRRQREQEQRLKEEKEREEAERLKRQALEAAERERRRRLLEEDADEQQAVEFPDIAAIEKLENKGENNKKSPTHILQKFKKVDDKPINDKAKKKLEDVARKNGIDPEFMADTFGVEKNHNPDLLNSIIDIHNHVNRDAVKQLFDPSSNPLLLQQLFGKNSTLNAQRLRELMNDPDAKQLIAKLASLEEGIVSPQIAKMLLDNNSKFTPEFVKKLLSDQNGADAQKLKELLRDQPDKAAREAALKALKKIGGDNLDNTPLLEGMLGKDSVLDQKQFTRAATDLPKSVLEKLFGDKKIEGSEQLVKKLLNNSKIDLKTLAPILQDPQLLEQLAKVLAHGDPMIQQNLLNLFKNGEPLDPKLLKDLISNPTLMQKLLGKQVDPAFLSNLLKKDAKTDLKLLEKAIEKMSDEQIEEAFKFQPQKNIDFGKLAKLFETNPKSDPGLISQLLTPELMDNLYSKLNPARPEVLNKLIEKGKTIDKENILKIYGDDLKRDGEGGWDNQGGDGKGLGKGQNSYGQKGLGDNGGRRDKGDKGDKGEYGEKGEKKYNITDNHFNQGGKGQGNHEEDSELGFPKSNENAMSRTDGGMMGFLSPIHVGLLKGKRNKGRLDPAHIDDISDEEVTQYNDGQGEEDSDGEQVEGGRRKKHKRKLKKKPLDDIRLPSEHIYLQRLQAPHEKKNLRKKKKKGPSNSMQQLMPMDEENEIYDLDF